MWIRGLLEKAVMHTQFKKWLKNRGLKAINYINEYPIIFMLTLSYGYAVFGFLLTCFMYISTITLAHHTEWHLGEMNDWVINSICIFLLFVSGLLAADFGINIKRIYQRYKNNITNIVTNIIEQVPLWMLKLIFLFLPLGAIWGLNQFFIQLSDGAVNIIRDSTKLFSKYSPIIISICGIILPFIINAPDLKTAFIYNNKLITNHEIKDFKKNTTLKLITTNIGKVKATYKFMEICTEDEKKNLYCNGFESDLPQPIAYYRNKNKNFSSKMKGVTLDENESCTYLFKFKEIPEEKFYIVFLKMPNRLFFISVEPIIQSKNEKSTDTKHTEQSTSSSLENELGQESTDIKHTDQSKPGSPKNQMVQESTDTKPTEQSKSSNWNRFKNSNFVKWAWPIFTVIIIIATPILHYLSNNAIKKIDSTEVKTEIVDNKQYKILKNKKYSRFNSYAVANTTLKIKKYQVLSLNRRKNRNYKCFLELSSNKNRNLYFTNCQIITKGGRKFDIKIESFKEQQLNNERIYQIITRELDLNSFKDIKNINLYVLNALNGKKDIVSMVIGK